MTKEQALEILNHPKAVALPKELLKEAVAVLAGHNLTNPNQQEPAQPVEPWWKFW